MKLTSENSSDAASSVPLREPLFPIVAEIPGLVFCVAVFLPIRCSALQEQDLNRVVRQRNSPYGIM